MPAILVLQFTTPSGLVAMEVDYSKPDGTPPIEECTFEQLTTGPARVYETGLGGVKTQKRLEARLHRLIADGSLPIAPGHGLKVDRRQVEPQGVTARSAVSGPCGGAVAPLKVRGG